MNSTTAAPPPDAEDERADTKSLLAYRDDTF
jgi:hypothetical protein